MLPRLTIIDFQKKFSDNNTCLAYLFKARFPNPKCAKCGGTKFYKHPTRACYTCGKGCTHLWPKEGTVFDHSSTDLVKWFFAIFLMSQSRNGVSAKELERALGVTYKCAYRIGQQIRKLMEENNLFLSGDVEADEALIGGRIKRKDRMKNKGIVFGAVERKGKVKASVVDTVSMKAIGDAVKSSVAQGSRLLTDKCHAYRNVASVVGYQHESVNHGAKEFVRKDVHTNTIEGFFSQFKRSIDGTYHVISPRKLGAYVSEFQWRYIHRKDDAHLFDQLLSRVTLPPSAGV